MRRGRAERPAAVGPPGATRKPSRASRRPCGPLGWIVCLLVLVCTLQVAILAEAHASGNDGSLHSFLLKLYRGEVGPPPPSAPPPHPSPPPHPTPPMASPASLLSKVDMQHAEAQRIEEGEEPQQRTHAINSAAHGQKAAAAATAAMTAAAGDPWAADAAADDVSADGVAAADGVLAADAAAEDLLAPPRPPPSPRVQARSAATTHDEGEVAVPLADEGEAAPMAATNAAGAAAATPPEDSRDLEVADNKPSVEEALPVVMDAAGASDEGEQPPTTRGTEDPHKAVADDAKLLDDLEGMGAPSAQASLTSPPPAVAHVGAVARAVDPAGAKLSAELEEAAEDMEAGVEEGETAGQQAAAGDDTTDAAVVDTRAHNVGPAEVHKQTYYLSSLYLVLK